MVENVVKFDFEKMKKFSEKDRLIQFMYEDLMKRGHGEKSALEIVFNSEILSDSIMENKYSKL